MTRSKIRPMPQPRFGRTASIAKIGVLALGAFPAVASADVCVTCASPDASYGCAVEGAPAGAADPSLTLYCIQALAKSGGHAQCSVARAVTAPCAGERRLLAAPSGFGGGGDGVNNTEAPVTAPGEAQPVSPGFAQPAGEPQTTTLTKTPAPPKAGDDAVETGAKTAGEPIEKTGSSITDAAETAGGYIEGAGQAVGNAAKKTWTCLSSFFGDC